jgi:hypothetical protein
MLDWLPAFVRSARATGVCVSWLAPVPDAADVHQITEHSVPCAPYSVPDSALWVLSVSVPAGICFLQPVQEGSHLVSK